MHIRSFRYTPEMVDCRYCTEHARKPPRCKLPRCPWIAERIEAGVVGYREAVSFYHRYNPKLRERLNSLVIRFPNSLWLTQAHQERMEHLKAVLHYSKKRNTPEWYAVLFLVSTSEDLYRRTINCFTKTSIDFSRASLRGISVSDYTLLMAAKTIYTGEERLTLAELEDREIVDDDTFRLVINAQLIARYGLPVLKITAKGGSS